MLKTQGKKNGDQYITLEIYLELDVLDKREVTS